MIELGALRAVTHLNCGSFRPIGAPQCVTHVLACRYEHGVILVDAGIGQDDSRRGRSSLGLSAQVMRPTLAAAETAHAQLRSLGISPSEVRGIVATHLDWDHANGILDFPDAAVYAASDEWDNAAHRAGIRLRARYPERTIAAIAPQVSTIDDFPARRRGDAQFDLSTVRWLDQQEQLGMIELPGHTQGHSAVVIRLPRSHPHHGRVLLHAGDAYFRHGDIVGGRVPSSTAIIERLLAQSPRAIRDNHRFLRRAESAGHLVICSHDRAQYLSLRDITDAVSTAPSQRMENPS